MSDVQVVLRADVNGLGNKGDVVTVSKGYSRNFLEPRGLALAATAGAIEQATAMRRARDIRDARERETAEEFAKVLVARTVTVTAKAGSGGRLFGSVTAADIAEAIQAETGLDIDRKSLHIDEQIKTVGEHQVIARPHRDVQFPVSIEVVTA